MGANIDARRAMVPAKVRGEWFTQKRARQAADATRRMLAELQAEAEESNLLS